MPSGIREKYGHAVRFCNLDTLQMEVCEDRKHQLSDHFCFVLGAGASVESNIPSGMELVDEWDAFIQRIYTAKEYGDWKAGLDIQAEEDKYAHYSDYYQKRFERNPQQGPVFIRNMTAQARPSVGYLALASIMTETENNIVITTNFDKLTETAIFRDTNQVPWVIGSASELSYLDLNAQYPKVLKIHGDMFLDMKNDTAAIAALEEEWAGPLTAVLTKYHPVFIGYAGNDPSFMDFLGSLGGKIKKPYWVYYRESELSEEIWSFMGKNNGEFIDGRIGFDGVILLLYNELGLTKDYAAQFEARTSEFKDRLEAAQTKLTKFLSEETKELAERGSLSPDDGAMEKVAEKIVGEERPEVLLYNYSSKPPAEQEALFQEVLGKFPNSLYVQERYAFYLWDRKEENEKAEQIYLDILSSHPERVTTLGEYASFLHAGKADYEAAEKYYLLALEKEDPPSAVLLGNYANFLYKVKQDFPAAEDYYLRSIKADPHHAALLCNYAIFLYYEKKDYPAAKEYYKRAIEADPHNANGLAGYAKFLHEQEGDYHTAEEYYKRALEADPGDEWIKARYAELLEAATAKA